ncbi:putative phosphoglycerate mutase pmu1 [Neophaeococcomyces mojaviensis]|uniref:Phosphoglycerate mutase pmu1 n=1 Tax=Neophaeococcomyces mojaviensis TaxID=3383035 RepID=A0ACC3A6Y9_9EURO|nr:putative phosphoglycerate mutase pmu1 [Knufia sp. JES_112]
MLPFYDLGHQRRHWLQTTTVVPILLFVTVLIAFVITMSEGMARTPIVDGAANETSHSLNTHFDFTAAASYFLPSLRSTEPSTFDPTTTNFGLISQAYDSDASLPDASQLTDWQRFAHHVSTLNAHAPDHQSYHVLYLARHGQGYHNLAERYYGTGAWDCYYSLLEGDMESKIMWADAHLSKLGLEQARLQSQFWESQLKHANMPVPAKWYVSPMERASRTAEITFQPLQDNGTLGPAHFVPTVKELLRETNGIHTCDRRSKRSVIAANYPKWKIEEGFAEEDELWDPIYRETNEAHTYRAALLLDDILSSVQTDTGAKGNYLSLTAHGGMINAILRAIGHREFQVNVGSAIAVLVKVEQKDGKRPNRHFGKGETAPKCLEDPLKAGLPGYKNLKEYVDGVEGQVNVLRATAN